MLHNFSKISQNSAQLHKALHNSAQFYATQQNSTQRFNTLQHFYKTLHNFTHLFCSSELRKELFKIVQNFELLHNFSKTNFTATTTIHNSTRTYTRLHFFNLTTLLHNFTNLYKTQQDLTKLTKLLHNFSQLNTTFTILIKTLQN